MNNLFRRLHRRPALNDHYSWMLIRNVINNFLGEHSETVGDVP